jgi:hypothetical protein
MFGARKTRKVSEFSRWFYRPQIEILEDRYAPAVVTVLGDPGDGHVDVNGLPQDFSLPTLRVGVGGDNVRGLADIFFFALPKLTSVTSLLGAHLNLQYLGISQFTVTVTPEFNADLFGLGARSTPTILSTDYYDGDSSLSTNTLIAKGFITPSTAPGSLQASNGSLLNFVDSLYQPDGTPKAAYAVFRANANVHLPDWSLPYRGYEIASADNTDNGGAFVPRLVLSLSSSLTLSGGFTVSATEGSDSGSQTVATFTDADPSATIGEFSASIDWGDGSSSAGTITQPGGLGTAFVVKGSHLYAEQGAYAITTTVTDNATTDLIRNGNFEQGNTGFTSAYIYSPGNIGPADTYDVLPNPRPAHGGDTASYGDHTTGMGLMMAVNGAATPGVVVWSESLSVVPESNYAFSIWISSWTAGSPATFDIKFNGVSVGTPSAPFPAAIWQQFSTNWNSDQNTALAIEIVDTDLSDGGNDFALDDISLIGPDPITTSAMSTAEVADAALIGTGRFTVSATEAGDSGSQMVARFTDANPTAPLSDFTTTIDWGDGNSSAGTITQPGGVGTAFVVTSSHTYAEEGSFTITVSITDVGGSTVSAMSAASVADATVLAKGGFNFTGTETVDTGNQTLATFEDPAGAEALADYSATIAWGDGSTSAGTISFNSVTQVFTVTGHHTYSEEGALTIIVTIHHDSAADDTVTSSAFIRPRFDLAGRVSSTGQWWLGQSDGSSFHNSLGTTWSTAVTWVDVHTGDFTGAGLQGLVGRVKETGQWWMSVPDGSGGFTTSLWDTWNPGVTWVDVKVGDFNGDSKMDIVGRVLETGQWWVAQSTGSSFTNSLWATWSTAATWVDVQVGDFSGDGKADITGRWLQGGSWWTGISSGSNFDTTAWAQWNAAVTWVDVNVGDFTGDGKADIVGRWAQTGQWWVGVSTGSSFTNSLWETWNPSATWVDVKVGDFNGDGKADITGRWLEGGSWWTAISNGTIFTTTAWAQWNAAVTWVDVQVGDFNGDGKMDITGRWQEAGQWWTATSTGTSFATSQWGTWNPAVTWVDVQDGVYV